MALNGWTENDFLFRNSGVWPGSLPLGVTAWIHTPGTSRATIYALGLVENTNQRRTLAADDLAAEVIERDTGNASASSPGIVANAWHPVAGLFWANDRRAAYHDGANKVINTTTRSVSEPNATYIGRFPQGTQTLAEAGCAEIAVWDLAAMTEAEWDDLQALLGTLVDGEAPNALEANAQTGEPWAGALLAYWRLLDLDDLDDLSGNGHHMTMTGTLSVFASHPPVAAEDDGPTLEVTRTRWRNDDGNEAEATFREAENTPTTAEVGETVRLRAQIQSTGDAGETAAELRWRKKGTADPWEPVQ
jgi:hypothetical protein